MLPLIAAGLSLGGSLLNKLFTSFSQRHQANKINPIDATYKESPYAQQRLGTANQMFNARLPGAGAAEQNLLATQGNTLAQVGRNATDSSQALALAAGIGAQTNQSVNELAGQEAQYKLAEQGQLAAAQEGMVNEGDKVYQDQVRKYNTALSQKTQLQNASMLNRQSFFNDIATTGMQLAFGKNKDKGGGGVSYDMINNSDGGDQWQ